MIICSHLFLLFLREMLKEFCIIPAWIMHYLRRTLNAPRARFVCRALQHSGGRIAVKIPLVLNAFWLKEIFILFRFVQALAGINFLFAALFLSSLSFIFDSENRENTLSMKLLARTKDEVENASGDWAIKTKENFKHKIASENRKRNSVDTNWTKLFANSIESKVYNVVNSPP